MKNALKTIIKVAIAGLAGFLIAELIIFLIMAVEIAGIIIFKNDIKEETYNLETEFNDRLTVNISERTTMYHKFWSFDITCEGVDGSASFEVKDIHIHRSIPDNVSELIEPTGKYGNTSFYEIGWVGAYNPTTQISTKEYVMFYVYNNEFLTTNIYVKLLKNC